MPLADGANNMGACLDHDLLVIACLLFLADLMRQPPVWFASKKVYCGDQPCVCLIWKPPSFCGCLASKKHAPEDSSAVAPSWNNLHSGLAAGRSDGTRLLRVCAQLQTQRQHQEGRAGTQHSGRPRSEPLRILETDTWLLRG